jgi:nucleotide-binding universal stress UspA family protein
MKRILIPVDGSNTSMFAVRRVVKQFMADSAMEIHLLNVQPAFSRDIAQFSSRRSRQELHREQSDAALAAARKELDSHSIPYAVHYAVGDSAQVIADTAARLHCDEIVMSTGRKNALTRLVEGSVAVRVVELSPVPVALVPGPEMSNLERFGIPAAIAAAAAAVIAAID